MGRCGTGRDRMGYDGTGRYGMGRDGMGNDGTGRDGTGTMHILLVAWKIFLFKDEAIRQETETPHDKGLRWIILFASYLYDL